MVYYYYYLYYCTFASPIHQNIKQCISLSITKFMYVLKIYFGVQYFLVFHILEKNVSQILENAIFPEVYNC